MWGTCCVFKPEILFEDNGLIAIDKPAGLLTVPDRWDKKAPNAHALLEEKLKAKVFVVHRLDKDTSGVLLFAKDEETHRCLSLQFETRVVRKYYEALARGIPPQDSGCLSYPIAQNPRRPGIMMSSPFGKPSQTEFKVLERFAKAGISHMGLTPLTGRTHQIRLHLQCAGFPVLCDEVYGSSAPLFLSALKRKYKMGKDAVEKPLLSRLALHAAALEFKHPQTKQPMRLEAPLPKDLSVALNYLRKFGK